MHVSLFNVFFTLTCFLLGVRHPDDPAFGNSCYCGSFHFLVSVSTTSNYLSQLYLTCNNFKLKKSNKILRALYLLT